MKYSYRLIRSGRKTMAIELSDRGEILVRAPMRVSKKEIDAFFERWEPWIDRHYEEWQNKLASEAAFDPTREEIEALRKKICGRVTFFAGKMGVEPRSVKITSAKTRFGSCSAKNALCFSTKLIPHSDAVIDYVVVHELAHIRQKNHSAAFYREIEKILPDYRERIRLLKSEENTK